MNARLSLIKQRHDALGLSGLRGAALQRKCRELRMRRNDEQPRGQTTVAAQSTRTGVASGGHVPVRGSQGIGRIVEDRLVLGQMRRSDCPAKSEKEGQTAIATQGQGDRTAAHRHVSSSSREGATCTKGNGRKLGGSCPKDGGIRQECQALPSVEAGNPATSTGNACTGSGGRTRNLNPSRQNLGAEHWPVFEASPATPPKSSPSAGSAPSRGAGVRDCRGAGGFQGQHLPPAGSLAEGGKSCTIGQAGVTVSAYAVRKVEHSDHKCPDVASAQPTPGAGAGSASIGKDIGGGCCGSWNPAGDCPDVDQNPREGQEGAERAGCQAKGLWTPRRAAGRGLACYRSATTGRKASTDRCKPWDKPANRTLNKEPLAHPRWLNSCFFIIDKAGPPGRMVFAHGLSMGRRRK